MESWDLIIIGAGAAGLSAGIYGARSGLKTLILEEKIVGGTTNDAPFVENYPGFQRITGAELGQRMATHCRGTGVTIRELQKVLGLELSGNPKIVKSSDGSCEGKTVIIASGAHYREINVPGEKEFMGRGVSYCGICDGPLFRDKHVVVIGGGNSALITTLYLADLALEVKVIHRRNAFRAEDALVKAVQSKRNIEALWNTEVKEIKGERFVEKIGLFDNTTLENRELATDGVFVQIGEDPNTEIVKGTGVQMDADGYVIVDIRQRTNIAGVFAAGDATNHPVKQIGVAVGQGITAALEAYGYIRRPYYHEP